MTTTRTVSRRKRQQQSSSFRVSWLVIVIVIVLCNNLAWNNVSAFAFQTLQNRHHLHYHIISSTVLSAISSPLSSSSSSSKGAKKTNGNDRPYGDNSDGSVRRVVNQKKKRKRNKSSKTKKKGQKFSTEHHNEKLSSLPSETTIETWRIFGITVHPDDLVVEHDAGSTSAKTSTTKTTALLVDPPIPTAVKKYLSDKFNLRDVPTEGCKIVRRSLDTRLGRRRQTRPQVPSLSSSTSAITTPTTSHYPVYNYVVDVPLSTSQRIKLGWKHRPGQVELLESSSSQSESNSSTKISSPSSSTKQHEERQQADLLDKQNHTNNDTDTSSTTTTSTVHQILQRSINENQIRNNSDKTKKVVIVGMGPAGLFCALQLALSSKGTIQPILLDRGQPVERRGRDIGALIHRSNLNAESNFCFGEGGAGTWSDGKLTTRIGRNSNEVRWVLELLVEFGAPAEILWQGAPHLGTDNLVRLLRNMRHVLQELGGEIHFGTKMVDLEIDDNDTSQMKAIIAEEEEKDNPDRRRRRFEADAFVLATGHSARDVYESLHSAGVQLEAKGFACGFRIEHPQPLINEIQLGQEWGSCVHTGKARTDITNEEYFGSKGNHPSTMPPPSYRLATDRAEDGTGNHRGVYSFCMCPGGQIVPASTDPNEVCVNGMSFSRRDSVWANSALVVSVAPDDDVLKEYTEKYGVMAGIEFQREMERRAAQLGGGNLTVPVQRVTDFVNGQVSETIPSSSYRLGVKSAACHEIYPKQITTALCDALDNHFGKQMPAYVNRDGLLHGVETRTSSPLRISRDPTTYRAIGTTNLFPSGEGAGFAGGIVSAAVDGLHVAEALLDQYVPEGENREYLLEKSNGKSVGYSY